MSEWMFITNHGLVLSHIAKHPRSTALEIANAVGITERTTRQIISHLETGGYLIRKKEGRRNKYRINPYLSLRHPTHGEIAVGDLLTILGWKKRQRRPKEATPSSPPLF